MTTLEPAQTITAVLLVVGVAIAIMVLGIGLGRLAARRLSRWATRDEDEAEDAGSDERR